MSSHPEHRSSASLRRFNQRMQLSRAAVFALGYAIALVLIPTGLVRLPPFETTAMFVLAEASALVFYRLAATPLGDRLGTKLSLASLYFDGVLLTAMIHLDGGSKSLIVIWYISNVAAATFTEGMRASYWMMAFDSICYLGLLSLRGELALAEGELFRAAGRLVFLFSASFFAFRGISESREKQKYVKQLQAEEKLKVEALTRLTQELDEQSKALASANVQIQQANRLKSQFLATMSHELRTPLNSVIGFANILEQSLSARADERELKFLGNILKSGEHLLSLINDLLDLSKIEAGRMEVNPETVDVEKALSGIRDVMRGTSSPRGIDIRVDVPADLPQVRVDLAKFKQIAFNLLSNAVKFSPDRSRIEVGARIEAAETSPLGVETLRVDVVDVGIGISRIDQEVIFEEFRQADDGFVRQYGGTGLGLTLVKRFLEIQGGTIEVESELGVGSRFVTRLPTSVEPVTIAAESLPDGQAGLPATGESESRRRILVVEDDPIAYANLAALIEQEGFAPVRARRGEDVGALIHSEQPALITLDLVLPGLDGWEVLKQLKADEATNGIPIVIVTILEDRELGLALGADDYFVKPIDREAFVRRIKELTLPGSSHAATSEILVVDDEEEVCDLVMQMLSPLGYKVTAVTAGEEALSRAQLKPPAVVVLDLLMPRMSGFEVALRLHESEATAHVPIIVLTGKELDAEERAKLQGRIVALFAKRPESRKGFIDAVREAVERGAKRLPDDTRAPE